MELIYTDWRCRHRNGFCIKTAICAIQLRRVSIIVEEHGKHYDRKESVHKPHCCLDRQIIRS